MIEAEFNTGSYYRNTCMDLSDCKGCYYYFYATDNGVRIYGDTLSGIRCEENGPNGCIEFDVRRRGPRKIVPGEEKVLPKALNIRISILDYII